MKDKSLPSHVTFIINLEGKQEKFIEKLMGCPAVNEQQGQPAAALMRPVHQALPVLWEASAGSVGAWGISRQFTAQDKAKYCWCMNYNADIILTASMLYMINLSPPRIIFLALCTTSPAFQEHFKKKTTSPLCVTLYYCVTE